MINLGIVPTMTIFHRKLFEHLILISGRDR